MTADVPATQGVRASAANVLAKLSRYIPVSALEALNCRLSNEIWCYKTNRRCFHKWPKQSDLLDEPFWINHNDQTTNPNRLRYIQSRSRPLKRKGSQVDYFVVTGYAFSPRLPQVQSVTTKQSAWRSVHFSNDWLTRHRWWRILMAWLLVPRTPRPIYD